MECCTNPFGHVNTADQNVLKDYRDGTTLVNDVNIIGAGRENLLSAVNTSVALDPVSVTFGAVPAGSGQTKTFDVTLTDLGNGGTYSVVVDSGDASVAYSVSAEPITLAAGASATVTITLTVNKGAAAGDHQAKLTSAETAAKSDTPQCMCSSNNI